MKISILLYKSNNLKKEKNYFKTLGKRQSETIIIYYY